MKTKLTKSLTLFFCILAYLMLATSCVVTSKVQKYVTYISPNLTKSSLNNMGLALLPIVAGSGVEGYRRPFGEAMNAVGDSILTNFMTWNITLDKINNANLVSEYNSAIQAYQETGIIDRTILQKLSGATGTNYFFFVKLSPPTADRKLTYGLGGLTTTETKSVSAFGLIWSASDGDVVWEGEATANVTTGDYTYTKETDMDRAIKVAQALMKSLP